jgi:D-serine deaminase-like pyridoxal phosphate-dependent protein
VRRSPLRTAAQAVAVARAARDEGLALVGLMFYDAQVAGLPDTSLAVRLLKSRSAADLRRRRAEVAGAVRDVADLEFVNGGGTGSLHVTGQDPVLTELAAGSGLFGPALFDGYRAFRPRPAAAFALPVVRRPAPGIVTVFGGGYIASGPPGWSRSPAVLFPQGLRLLRGEGAGEVQTPLRGDPADRLALGDRVWFRHAKAGELCERFDELHLVEGDQVVDRVPTYRGEAASFG